MGEASGGDALSRAASVKDSTIGKTSGTEASCTKAFVGEVASGESPVGEASGDEALNDSIIF